MKTFRSKKYLEFVRSLPCCICGAMDTVVPHHTETGGVSMKGSDAMTIPLCYKHHDEHDRTGKRTFYLNHATDVNYELVQTLRAWVEKGE